MKGNRRFITVTRWNPYLKANGDWEPIAVPVASITSIEPAAEPPPGARGRINVKGEVSYYYTRESLEELVRQIETEYSA